MDMKKLLFFCLLLISVVAQAEDSRKYGNFVVTQNVHASGGVTYALSYLDIPVLGDYYQFMYQEDLQFIVMYNKSDVYVFYKFKKNPIFDYHFNEPLDQLPMVVFEKVDKLPNLDASCYEVSVKVSEDDPDEILIGTFCEIAGNTYRYSLIPIE